MDSDQVLRIAYAGSLSGYAPHAHSESWWTSIKDWIWTFQVRNIRNETRSGYFLFRGLQHLKKTHPEIAASIQIHLWGKIAPLNQQQVDEMGISDMVVISGYKTKAQTQELLKASDILFLPLESEKDGQKPLFIPGKLYEYLSMEKPVLALVGESDCRDILTKARIGYFCDPFDAENIAQGLQYLYENRTKLQELFPADRAYIQDHFSFENITARLAKTFDKALKR